MNTDPIADMLTRIRNAASASSNVTYIPHSKIKESIANILKTNNFIAEYSVEEKGAFKQIVVTLHTKNAQPQLSSLIRVSKPGRRVYAAAKEIPTVLGGRGIVIVSTPQGLMTGRDARRSGLGGELICKVY
jgi:small subunit ribosomal protein S8